MNMEINKTAFLNKLNSKAVLKGPTLKQYVLLNLEFLIDCQARGYTLTALSEVISEDLGKKIYPSNLGRLLRKYQTDDLEVQSRVNEQTDELTTEEPVLNKHAYEELFEAKTLEQMSSKSPRDKDPLGIGDLMWSSSSSLQTLMNNF